MKRLLAARRCLAILLVLLLLPGESAFAEGLFPSMEALFGTPLPSLGVALGLAPKETVTLPEGEEERYSGFSLENYIRFGQYLSGAGAETAEYHVNKDAVTVELRVGEARMRFCYNWAESTATALYAPGTSAELRREEVAFGPCLLPPVNGMLPTPQYAVGRMPDEQTKDEQGITQVYQQFTYDDYVAYSTCLGHAGAVLTNAETAGEELTAGVTLGDMAFVLTYAFAEQSMRVQYPADARLQAEEWVLPADGEAVLPWALSQTFVIPLPSLSEALHRWPDSETENADGSVTEAYSGVTETEFDVFSRYLREKGAKLTDYAVEGRVLSAHVAVYGTVLDVRYDRGTLRAEVTCPRGSCNAHLSSAKAAAQTVASLLEAEEWDKAMDAWQAMPDLKQYMPALESLYRAAAGLKEQKQYAQAQKLFAAISGYRDAGEQAAQCDSLRQMADTKGIYQQAVKLKKEKKYEEARKLFLSIADYKDAKEQAAQCKTLKAEADRKAKYDKAVKLKKQKKYDKARAAFLALSGYKDADKQAWDCFVLQCKSAKKGKTLVTFGHYEQDNDTANGAEEIEWIVLDVRDGRALLLSRYGLDCQPYQTPRKNTTWALSPLRTWLNKTFYKKAFDKAEQAAVVKVKLSNDSSQSYSTWHVYGGKDTKDRVFLLSFAEAEKYLKVRYAGVDNQAARAVPTAYALAQGANAGDGFSSAEGKPTAPWWLRSPGFILSRASVVHASGSLVSEFVEEANILVRPALWVSLE